MLSRPHKHEAGMLACIARWEWLSTNASYFMRLGMRVVRNFVNTGLRNFISRFEFLRHNGLLCVK